jgi:hypothetical protein
MGLGEANVKKKVIKRLSFSSEIVRQLQTAPDDELERAVGGSDRGFKTSQPCVYSMVPKSH